MKDIKTKESVKKRMSGIVDPDLSYRMRKGLLKGKTAANQTDDADDDYVQTGTDNVLESGEMAVNRFADDIRETSKAKLQNASERNSVNQSHKAISDDTAGCTLQITSIHSPKVGATNTATPSFRVQQTSTPRRSNLSAVESGRKLFIGKRQQEKKKKKISKTAEKRSTAIGRIAASTVHSVKKAVTNLYLLLAAGGIIPAVIIILICSIGLAVGSSFGVFFSGEDTGSGKTMQTVIQEINEEYGEKISRIKRRTDYDYLEMSGSTAIWREVLSVYAVKLNTDPTTPREVVSLDDEKIAQLKQIFWDMNYIHTGLEIINEPVEIEVEDDVGNIITVVEEIEKLVLKIEISHKTAAEMADEYDFDDDQRNSLVQLLDSSNSALWAAVMYGIHDGDTAIIEVAKSQIGNVGGEPYWSWYGYSNRVEWCSCFVSWCANECGYIDAGLVPKHAGPPVAVSFYKARDQWLPGNAEPAPGMIIFFDWDNKGRSGDQNGSADHIGIVEKVEDGWVWTIEGNTSDSVARRRYRVGHYEILGYGYIK